MLLQLAAAVSASILFTLAPSNVPYDYNNYASKYDVLNGGQVSSAIGIDNLRSTAAKVFYSEQFKYNLVSSLHILFSFRTTKH